MAGPARMVGVTVPARMRPARMGLARMGLAGIGLAGIALAGCGSAAMTGRTGTTSPAGAARSSSASSSPGVTVASGSPSPSNGPNGAASPVAGAGGSGPGCAPWPAGSTSTTLLITRASDAQRYCVRVGQTVQVSSAGTLSLTAGSKPPRLTGTALVPAPARPGQAVRAPAATYLAARAGVAMITVVRLPCQSVQASPAAGQAGEMAWVRTAGGAPVGAQCQLVQALRVTIAVS